MQTSILLADPHAIFRHAVRALIEKREDLFVIGEASDGQEAMNLAQQLKPELIITEIAMPRLSGIELTRRLARSSCRLRVLILSMHEGRSHVADALRAGASGYVVKTGSGDDLLQAIDAVREGRSYLSPALAQHLVDIVSDDGDRRGSGLSALSSREREVLQLIAEGLASKEIAAELGVSPRTIESHRYSLMEKLDVHKISGLVRLAIREGLVTP